MANSRTMALTMVNLAAHISAVSEVITLDSYRVPLSACSFNMGAPPSFSRPTLHFPFGDTPNNPQALSGISGYRPPSTSEQYTSHSSHLCLDQAPFAPARGRSHPHCYGDLSDYGTSDARGRPENKACVLTRSTRVVESQILTTASSIYLMLRLVRNLSLSA